MKITALELIDALVDDILIKEAEDLEDTIKEIREHLARLV